MANYCTTTFVKYFNVNRTYNTTSKPTLTQVASVIPTVTGEMNARFAGVGISIPITTSPTHNAYLYVKRLCALKTICIAENTAFVGGNKNESPHAAFYCKEYEEKMKAIEKNPSILNALISGTSASMDSLEYSDASTRRDTEPFTRGENDW